MPPVNRIELDRHVRQARLTAGRRPAPANRRAPIRQNNYRLRGEAKRNSLKAQKLARDRGTRFRKVAQVGIPVGVTNHESPDGAGDIVYYVAHIDDNVYCKRLKGNFCTDSHVIFEPSFDRNQCRALAREKYRESMALQQLEISGDMSTAEAPSWPIDAREHGMRLCDWL